MIAVETKLFPLVLIAIPPEGVPEADQRAMLDTLAGFCRRAQREGVRPVALCYAGLHMSPRERQTLALLMRDFPQDLLDLYLAAYVVADSEAVRGIITALRWLSPQLELIDCVPTVDLAIAGAEAAFREARVAVPPAIFRDARRWLMEEWARRGNALAAS